ncbi:ABC transporter substrate-binding protein [Paenibacillus sp. Leaf72]|uniref:ABC transporter substrate-binding protein n=1 Tax=Paenibacillus sp. Leaf72 TaxID=1736234 RepID=UPI0006FCDF0B|nr:ABC transporter substrate-binding protein [Paenibacillus sp. Leaf72]KQO17817.1 hypothetical protein ASF12_03915 [Paenibacillus sp. Leaf72]
MFVSLFSASKRLIFVSAAALLMLLLAACGSNAGHSAEGAGSTPAAAATESASAQPAATEEQAAARIYKDVMGREVELPSNPQRIVAHYYASEMMALGFPMVGTNFLNAKAVLGEEKLQGIADVSGEGVSTNLEKVLALEPDLIIVPNFLDAAEFEELSKIAPTVVIDYSGDIFSRLRSLSEIVGKPEQAEDWIKKYEAKSEEKRELLKPVVAAGGTASAFVVHVDGKLYIYGPQRLGPTMYDALGFKAPDKVGELFKDGKDLWKEISLEALPDFAGDHIFLILQDDNEDAKKGTEEIINGAVWKNIPAVKNGHAYIVGKRWSFNDPLTLDWLLDEMTNELLAKQ